VNGLEVLLFLFFVGITVYFLVLTYCYLKLERKFKRTVDALLRGEDDDELFREALEYEEWISHWSIFETFKD